jgi:hypothetical protein
MPARKFKPHVFDTHKRTLNQKTHAAKVPEPVMTMKKLKTRLKQVHSIPTMISRDSKCNAAVQGKIVSASIHVASEGPEVVIGNQCQVSAGVLTSVEHSDL